MNWKNGLIDGCRVEPLNRFHDARGYLAEFFRHDDLEPDLHPAMGYVSLTHPAVTRGPHAHRDQTDLFAFFHGIFRLYLWDARAESATFGHRQVFEVGEANPSRVIIPPGVVHAYRNTGPTDALIVNCPNRLYAGRDKKDPVDEIRYEDQEDSPFVMD